MAKLSIMTNELLKPTAIENVGTSTLYMNIFHIVECMTDASNYAIKQMEGVYLLFYLFKINK